MGPLAIVGASAAAVGGVVALGDALLGRASEIQELSTISGVGAETLQRWGAAARESGGSAEDVADAARELQLRLAEASSLASGPAVDALNLLGLSLEELEGIPVDEQLALIRDRLSEVHDPAQRLFLAEELLGGSSERLVSALSATSDELDRFKVSSDETIETLSAADRLVQEFTSDVWTLGSNILVAMIDPFGEARYQLSLVNEQLGNASSRMAVLNAELQTLKERQDAAKTATESNTLAQVAFSVEVDGSGSSGTV